jgi:hypothetical protein
MNLKKSNREGTGKKHKCLYCSDMVPLHKKYCNRDCYNKDHYVNITCTGCGVIKSVVKNQSDLKYCSIQCANSHIDRKETHIKGINTLKEKYGVENPFEIKGYENIKCDYKKRGQSIKKTWENKTDDEKKIISSKISFTHSNRTDEEKNITLLKVKDTNLHLYGAEWTLSKNSTIRMKTDMNSRYSFFKSLIIWLKENDLELLDKYRGVKDENGEIIYYQFKHISSGNIFIDHVACGRKPIYKDPNKSIGISVAEEEIQLFIKENTTYTLICNNRKLVKGLEIDMYIPELNLAIEYNGLKWHSELNGKDRNYHLYKTEECNKKNIHLIHIFEDEWKHKKNIIKSKILNLLGVTSNKIYARKCEIREINNKDKNEFLNKTHIQGEDKSKIKIGLYYKDELVSIMTFGNLRKVTGNKHKDDVYELIRFSTKLNTNVIGGFSKLLKYFIKNYSPHKIISFADRRYSLGNVYEVNNFVFVNNTPPNYWYMRYYNKREHRFAYRKSELGDKLEKFNKDLSEWENMKLNKYDRIWDCGSKKYELILISTDIDK